MNPSHLSCSLDKCSLDAAIKDMESCVINYHSDQTIEKIEKSNLLQDPPREVEAISEYGSYIIESKEAEGQNPSVLVRVTEITLDKWSWRS